MERAAAMRKLRRVLGDRAYARIQDRITSPERRRSAMLERLEAEFRFADVDRDARERKQALLAADATYQQLWAERTTAYHVQERSGANGGYRFEVGTRVGIFTQPRAYGDTWEEIFTTLESK